jgi:hypothetical protein
MENISVLEKPATTTERKVRSYNKKAKISPVTGKNNLVTDRLVAEVDEDFKNYLDWHGLSNEDNLLVLSSQKHYYYDYEELKEVTTLINLKKLNLIKHLDDFLHSVYNGLSPKANFIGCFADTKSQKGVSLSSRLYKKFINILDAKIDADINSREFSRLLESHGFKIMDMTEINGLTYFRTQNL